MISTLLFIFLLLKTKDKTARYIYAVAIWTLLCFSMTEVLSLFSAINAKMLWTCWLGLDAVLLVLNIIKYRNCRLRDLQLAVKEAPDKKGWLLWGIFAVVMMGLAVKTVPYNWDSMTYHLPRLFHWAQNGSVDYYATGIDRQVSSPIGGAYINLHVYVMTNCSDRFVNLLQCCSFLTNGLLVYYIAKKIGCSKKFCNLAALFFYSMPIAFAEAFTTQVDNISALWMLAIIYLLLELLHCEHKIEWNKETLARVTILSLCVAFGYLTKPSIGIGLVFFAIWLLIMAIKRKDRVKPISLYLIIAGIILGMLVTPGFARNLDTFDAISAPGVGQRQLVGTLKPTEVLVNCAKNVTFNMPTIWIYDSSTIIKSGVIGFSELLNVDINNPAISEDGREFSVHSAQGYGHDTAINPVIVWLLLLCIILWIIKNRKRHFSEMRNCYFIVAAISFVAFCALLRWEPFVSRYMISYLAVLCPALAGQLEMFFDETENEKHKAIGIRVMTLVYFLCITELFGLAYCHGRIALTSSRYSGYFRNYADIEEAYRKAADIVNDKGYENIGLMIGGDTYEYPLTVMLEDYSRLEHVNVSNATAIYEDTEFIPDIIIGINYPLEDTTIHCHGIDYEVTEVIDGSICLMEK